MCLLQRYSLKWGNEELDHGGAAVVAGEFDDNGCHIIDPPIQYEGGLMDTPVDNIHAWHGEIRGSGWKSKIF